MSVNGVTDDDNFAPQSIDVYKWIKAISGENEDNSNITQGGGVTPQQCDEDTQVYDEESGECIDIPEVGIMCDATKHFVEADTGGCECEPNYTETDGVCYPNVALDLMGKLSTTCTNNSGELRYTWGSIEANGTKYENGTFVATCAKTSGLTLSAVDISSSCTGTNVTWDKTYKKCTWTAN